MRDKPLSLSVSGTGQLFLGFKLGLVELLQKTSLLIMISDTADYLAGAPKATAGIPTRFILFLDTTAFSLLLNLNWLLNLIDCIDGSLLVSNFFSSTPNPYSLPPGWLLVRFLLISLL